VESGDQYGPTFLRGPQAEHDFVLLNANHVHARAQTPILISFLQENVYCARSDKPDSLRILLGKIDIRFRGNGKMLQTHIRFLIC
jgi:hypothetical protein